MLKIFRYFIILFVCGFFFYTITQHYYFENDIYDIITVFKHIILLFFIVCILVLVYIEVGIYEVSSKLTLYKELDVQPKLISRYKKVLLGIFPSRLWGWAFLFASFFIFAIMGIAFSFNYLSPKAFKLFTFEYQYNFQYKSLIETMNLIHKLHPNNYSDRKLEDIAISSLIKKIDKYNYYTPPHFGACLDSPPELSYGIGIGIRINDDRRSLKITHIMESSPAEKVGLASNDLIVSIDGKPLNEDNIDNYLYCWANKGEKGSTTTLDVMRGDSELKVRVARECMVGDNYFFGVIEKKYLYIYYNYFAQNKTAAITGSIIANTAEGYLKHGIIIDLRNNRGGSADEEKQIETIIKKRYLGTPIAILTNEKSASAAESFILNMKPMKLMKVIGKRTYGKGMSGREYNLPNGGSVYLITNFYKGGETIEGKGINPDIEVEAGNRLVYENLKCIDKGDDINYNGDTQIEAAIHYLDECSKNR